MIYQHSDPDLNDSNSMNDPGPNHSGQSPSPKRTATEKPDAPTPKGPPSSVMIRCSYCGDAFEKSESKHMPFCSRRCQEIDLGMWLNESYRFPHEGDAASHDYGSTPEED